MILLTSKGVKLYFQLLVHYMDKRIPKEVYSVGQFMFYSEMLGLTTTF